MMTDKTGKLIAARLKKLRQKQGITQAELAKKARISTNYYARVERYEVSPSIETIEKVIKALGVRSSDILPF